jgi:hypothetical protein
MDIVQTAWGGKPGPCDILDVAAAGMSSFARASEDNTAALRKISSRTPLDLLPSPGLGFGSILLYSSATVETHP